MNRALAPAIFALALPLAAGCGRKGAIDCDDLVPPAEARYSRVHALFTGPGPKTCARCHNTDDPVYGYNFEGPGVTYDALIARIDPIYQQVAAGTMPPDGERWSPEDLRLLRSWYCQGAIYEE